MEIDFSTLNLDTSLLMIGLGAFCFIIYYSLIKLDASFRKRRREKEMRYCWICGKPMYSSNESIWYHGMNYDIHKKCKKEFAKSGGRE